jgi:hypothetical protein
VAIHAFGATRSLRSLAAEFGVNHETVRAVIRGEANHGGRGNSWYPETVPGPSRRVEGPW